MSGLLDKNPLLESFELVTVSAYTFLNFNNYLENFEDIEIGPCMRKLVLRDAMKYGERTNFLGDGTKNLLHLDINKSILNQKNFCLSDKLRVLMLNPINFPTEIFEITFE